MQSTALDFSLSLEEAGLGLFKMHTRNVQDMAWNYKALTCRDHSGD